MKRNGLVIFLTVFLVLSFTLSSLETVMGQGSVEEKVFEAFRAIADAERSGGDVSSLKNELNAAMDLINRAQANSDDSQLQEALTKLENIITSAVTVAQKAAVDSQTRLMFVALYVGVFGISCFLAYRYVPIVFWSLWVKVKKSWRVQTAHR